MPKRLGELLVKKQLISADELSEALQYQQQQGWSLRTCLTKLGFITDDEITDVLSREYGLPLIKLNSYKVDAIVISLIPPDMALRHQVVPLSRVGSTLTVAMVDPTNAYALDEIKVVTGLDVYPVVATEASIREAIAKLFSDPSKQ